jgi:hypothetical protein
MRALLSAFAPARYSARATPAIMFLTLPDMSPGVLDE